MYNDVNTVVKSVDSSTWEDLEMLFQSEDGPGPCWIMRKPVVVESQRLNKFQFKKRISLTLYNRVSSIFSKSKVEKKDINFSKLTVSKLQMQNNIPVGLLIYINNIPVAWCSVTPLDSCFKQDDSDSKNSMRVCIFVNKKHRNANFSAFLINQIKIYAKANEAEYIETCQINLGSTTYKSMDLLQTFRNEGFELQKGDGKSNKGMLLKL